MQKVVNDENLANIPEVSEFLQVQRNNSDDATVIEPSGSDDDAVPMEVTEPSTPLSDVKITLGPSEVQHAKPGDFEFLNMIGKGSFGKVLLARHKKEQKTYAVKVLAKKMILKRNEKAHIMCERNVLLKNLNHPFLVGLRYSFQSQDKLYFVLDYVNGGELFFHLQKERFFTEARAKFYAAEITTALGYLHSEKIVYR